MENGKETAQAVQTIGAQLSFEDYINLTAALNRSVTQCAVLARENQRLAAELQQMVSGRTES